MYSTPCNSGFTCRQCLSMLHSVWVELLNSSTCCYNSPADVDDEWITMTSDVAECPIHAESYEGLVIGFSYGLVCLLVLAFVIWAYLRGLWDCPYCCGRSGDERMDDDDDSTDSGRSSVTLSTTSDEED